MIGIRKGRFILSLMVVVKVQVDKDLKRFVGSNFSNAIYWGLGVTCYGTDTHNCR
jgi:hypothetical protein